MNQPTRRRVYAPPEPEEIEEAAALLRQRMDRDRDFEDGFSKLLKSIAKAYAHNLTRSEQTGELDNDPKSA